MRKIENSVLQKNRSDQMARTYFILFAASFVLTVVSMMLTNGRAFTDTLYYGRGGDSDAFMDFYNSIRDAGTKDVYRNGIIYPPLANMFFYFLSKLVDPELVATSFKDRHLLQSDMACQVLLFAFFFFSLAIAIRLIRLKAKERFSDGVAWGLSLALALSYPMIYCLQRGNLLLLSMALSMFFVFFRNDERKWVRELSLIALAIAAGFKLYPAVLGLLLVREKHYKRALRLVAYGLVFTILPFFFYDGFTSMRDLINNLRDFSDSRRITPAFATTDVFAAYAEMFLHINFDLIHLLLFWPAMTAAVAMFFLNKDEWKRVFCLVYLFLNINSSGQTYILIFLLIPFVLFLLEEHNKKSDWLYFLLFVILLIYIPSLHYRLINPTFRVFVEKEKFYIRLNQLFSAPALQGMLLLVSVETIAVRIRKRKEKRTA